MKTILVFTNCKDLEEAKKIAATLLDKKLIACANIYPVQSHYSWKGELKEETEFTVLMKSDKSQYEDIEKEIKLVHSYENPEILAVDVSGGSKDYTDWVSQSLQN